MKKPHLVLFIITAFMSLFSSYSLAAMNRVYKINFEWYSEYSQKYISGYREAARDKWQLKDYPESIRLGIIGAKEDLQEKVNGDALNNAGISGVDFNRYILIYCSLGKFYSPEYRVRFLDIAQRGNVVEVRFSMNSPSNQEEKNSEIEYPYYPRDMLKIDRSSFSEKGELIFIFKNQDGIQFFEQKYKIK